MKRHFGEHKFRIKTLAAHAGVSVENAFQLVAQESQRVEAVRKLNDQELAEYHAIQAEELILRGDATHYFIESESLADALPRMVREWEAVFLETIFTESRAGVIHTCGKNPRAICFNQFMKGGPASFVAFDDLTLVPWWGMARSKHTPEILASKIAPMLDLVFGLGLYLRCFPKALKEGFPDFAKHPAHYKGQACASVTCVPEIIDRTGPTPHYRNGHFRVLASPRFTHKRYEVIFVRETFVLGRMKTVIDERNP